jgi:hypothetical protein
MLQKIRLIKESMMKKVIENLNSVNGNYLFPFFWQHGESNEILSEYIDQMYDKGIRNFCVESRPHPDFLENGWWNNLDFIIKKSKEKNMKIWILDDAKFPTGYANGKVPTHLKKKYLACNRLDVVGPMESGELNLQMLAGPREFMSDKNHEGDQFLKAVLVENDISEKNAFNESMLTDISHFYEKGTLKLNLKAKHYSIFILYTTNCGGETETSDYLDPMNKEATRVLLSEVYEKHYARYKDEFGKTITGFFSDEPRFGNTKGTNASIGRLEMVLPWNEQVMKRMPGIAEKELLFLFFGESERAYHVRFVYMNAVSKLYSDNFSKEIGTWCKQKGIDYTGHVIEDNNAHSRLGYGAGHFFRSIEGQSMSGIDIIGGQVVPGMNYPHTAFTKGGSDGEFYHYALVKMGASAAKLDPKKRGILMCEAFGAYGWVEGLKMMKWITDHMISHGVNLIVPHAFSPKEFPDWDCPPHFYARGNNPQFPYFSIWSSYADRLCHLMSGGHSVTKIGVLYHAFSEWSGNYMPIQKVLRTLQENQIGCDVISEDYLYSAQSDENFFKINDYRYEVLIVPYSQRLPEDLMGKLEKLSHSVKIIFVENFPDSVQCKQSLCLELEKIPQELKEYEEIKLSKKEPLLVYYHYRQNDGDIYMFNNEEAFKTISTQVTLANDQELQIYDAMENKLYHLNSWIVDGKRVFDLNLDPYNSLILVSGHSKEKKNNVGRKIQSLKTAESLSLLSYNSKINLKKIPVNELKNLSGEYPNFSGSITYHYTADLLENDVILEVESASEIVEVFVNGQLCGSKIFPPYCFDISKFTKIGKNKIDIKVVNTLARDQRDPLSQYFLIEPLGITGDVNIFKRK